MRHIVRRHRARRDQRRGVLTFEWILLISLLVIGIIGDMSAVRDALICELNDVAQAIEAMCTADDFAPASAEPCTCEFGDPSVCPVHGILPGRRVGPPPGPGRRVGPPTYHPAGF